MTAVLWGIAFVIFGVCIWGGLRLDDTVLQVATYWLVAVACTLFWATFMRVSAQFVDEDWHIAYEIGPDAILAPGRDRRLDLALARGLARDRSADYWPPATWRLFGWFAAVFWLASAAATAAALSGAALVPADDRTTLLVLLMAPAVQFTAAAIVGPGLTRMLKLREGAREARRRVCEQGSEYELLRTLNTATPEQLRHAVDVLVKLGYADAPTLGEGVRSGQVRPGSASVWQTLGRSRP
ncbi:hypothetical protein KGA66_21025 [Actinocrinis puniceicyclus]|uniref:Uncharacterized protein n=1 Tax=Actinocrinis puniceicyclus TaxID=977794 RepID=A0A8J7WNB2_9ACTN|nr:hypothetical protein [Actinocrinis puniceicyclus]MBS2965546.1 hypothetical protein [Actinocrinis puniceicyclus]